MARCIQEINATHHLYSDHQKGFIKKTNGCTDHGIILNELFHDTNRHHKGLIVTAANTKFDDMKILDRTIMSLINRVGRSDPGTCVSHKNEFRWYRWSVSVHTLGCVVKLFEQKNDCDTSTVPP
jgi:hypothetical protein